MDVLFFMLCLLFDHIVHSLDVTISGQTYIESGVPYNVSCTVNEYRDNRKTTFSAIIPGEQNGEIIIWYYKPYGCFMLDAPTATDCRDALCACDDNGLTTHWIYTSPSDLSTSVTFQCASSDNNNTIITSTQFAPTITEGPGTSLRFNRINDTVFKEFGQQFSVLCLADCTPVCQFHWEKDNSVVSPGATLQISNLSKEDNGIFTCIANNGYGTPATKPLYLTVNYGPQAVTLLPPGTEYTLEKETTIPAITCTSDCIPSCEYTWSGPNIPSGTTNVLSLNNIQKNQTGVYNCTAYNKVGRLVSSDVKVNVQFGAGSSLQFEPSNTSVSTTKGDQLGPINCVAICNPPCHYIWTKPDKESINGSQLMLKSLSIEDHGQFTCTATNGIVSSVNKSLDVIVNYGPQSVTFLPNKTQYTATEGSNIAPINCTSNCRPICKYTWSGHNVPAGTNNVLSLENINANQMGDFICLAYNDVGSLNSSAVNVNIQFGPGSSLQFKPNATSVTKIKGEKLGPIECIATCNPSCQYKWSNHDETTNGGNLTVEHLSIEDHGLFLCTASNGFGDSQNKSFHATVNCFPRLNEYIQQPPRRMRLLIGTNLNLTVGIIAYPKLLQVSWNFQPSTSSNDDRNNNYTTNLKSNLFTHVAYFYKYNLEKGDFGNYTLEIQNAIGGIVVHFYVDQAGLPDPPTGLLAICEKSPMVVLWKPGFNGGSPQWFTVIWEDLKTNTSIVKSSIPDSDNGQYVTITTSSLSDGATYIIHVEASNKYGRVKATMYEICTTKQAEAIQSENSTAVGVAVGIGTSLIILILAAIVVFIVKRRRRRKNTEGNVIYEATQAGLRELSSKEDHIYNDLQQFQGDNTNKQRDQVAYANLSF